MYLNDNNREEALKVLRFLEVAEEKLKYVSCFYEGCWMHRYEGWLGGRDGWSGLSICRPPFEKDWEQAEWDNADEDKFVEVDGVKYLIREAD